MATARERWGRLAQWTGGLVCVAAIALFGRWFLERSSRVRELHVTLPESLPLAAPFTLVWFTAPVLAYWLSQPPRPARAVLTHADVVARPLQDFAQRPQ